MLELIAFVISLVPTILLSVSTGAFENLNKLWLFFVMLIGFFVLSVVLIFVVLFVISKFVDVTKELKKPSKVSYVIAKIIIAFLNRYAGIRVKIRGGELIKNQQYLLICNHRSNFDPMIKFMIFSRCKPVMISKPENFKKPIAGAFIYKCGFIPIDRNDNRKALDAINRAVSYVEKYGFSIAIYPEGSRNKNGRYLQPFKAGAFKIAKKANIPIAVITLEGTENIHKNFPLKTTTVYCDVLKIITPEEFANMSTVAISEYCKQIMSENIDKYGKAEQSEINKIA